MSANPIRIKFFVSYRKKDNVFSSITKVMEDAFDTLDRQHRGDDGVELSYFIDDDELMTGMNWAEAIVRNVHDANVFVPIYTPAYFQENADEEGIDWCEREYEEFGRAHPKVFDRADTVDATALCLPFIWKPLVGVPNSERYLTLKKVQGYNLADEVRTYETDHRKSNTYRKIILDSIVGEFERAITILRSSCGVQDGATVGAGESAAPAGTPVPAGQQVPAAAPAPADAVTAAPDRAAVAGATAARPAPGTGGRHQDHSGSAEAHELVVRIYDALAEVPFTEGSAERTSRVNERWYEEGVLERVRLTNDLGTLRLAQGLNFNEDTDAPHCYLSGNRDGIPNDGFLWLVPDGKGVRMVPKAKGHDTYVPWQEDFENMLEHSVAMIRRAARYRALERDHGAEWQERWERFLASGTKQGRQLQGNGWFMSANTRFEFVRDGRLVPLREIDGDSMDRPIIDMTEPDEVDRVIDAINALHGEGVMYFRQGAAFDTQTDATNCLRAIREYRDFLAQ